jgi:hypothetical protein
MYKEIETYLRRLRDALRGADRATIQDALADAEEHLTTAFERARTEDPRASAEEIFASVIEEYGSPEEVAMAYKDIETRVSPALAPSKHTSGRSAASRFFGVVADPRAYGALIYMLLSMITGIFYATWAITGISLSAGLIILVIGLPFLTVFLISVRGIGLIEGRIVEAMLGIRMPRRPVFLTKNLTWWRRVKTVFSDRTTWTAFVYMILLLPLGIIYFTIALSLLILSAALVVEPILWYGFHFPVMTTGGYTYYIPGWLMPLVVCLGGLLFVLSLHLARWLGAVHGRFAKKLLVRGE